MKKTNLQFTDAFQFGLQILSLVTQSSDVSMGEIYDKLQWLSTFLEEKSLSLDMQNEISRLIGKIKEKIY